MQKSFAVKAKKKTKKGSSSSVPISNNLSFPVEVALFSNCVLLTVRIFIVEDIEEGQRLIVIWPVA